jgi:aminopeptidase
MTDTRIERLAKLFVSYSLHVKPKESVIIEGTSEASPLIRELYRECLLADAYPQIFAHLETRYMFFQTAKEHQLTYLSPINRYIMENSDVMIHIFCEPNPKELTSINPEKIRKQQAAGSELAEIMLKREEEGKLRWGGLPYPIGAQAQEAAMAPEEYGDFVYSSCLVDKEDPVAEWRKIQEEQDKLCGFLNKADRIHIAGADTDITFGVKDRTWINCSGQANMPDGEVFTSPIENSVNGTIRFTYPGIVSGREIEDIRLTFKDGKVIKASAAKGDDFLQQMLKIEGADCLGEAAIGTNYGITRFTKNMLFDEKMGGTIHMALGMNPWPKTGGKNKSAVHWDILKDMKDGEIYADDTLIYKNGKFLKTY